MLSKELAFQINLRLTAAGNLHSVMWFPLKPLYQVSKQLQCAATQGRENYSSYQDWCLSDHWIPRFHEYNLHQTHRRSSFRGEEWFKQFSVKKFGIL